MSYVKSICITGLNNRKDKIDINLNRGINVFFGLNGSGKTSILRIIDSAMGMDASTISDINFESAQVIIYSEQFKSEFKLECKKSKKDSQSSIRSIISKIREIETEGSGIIKILGTNKGEEFDISRIIGDTILEGGSERQWISSQEISPGLKNRWERVFLSTNRLYSSGASPFFLQSKGNIGISERNLDKIFAETIQRVWGKQFARVTKNINQIQEDGLKKILAKVLSPPPAQRHSSLKKRNSNVAESYEKTEQMDAESAYNRMERFLGRQSNESLKHTIGEKDSFFSRYKKEPLLQEIVKYIYDIETKIDVENQQIRSLSDLIYNLFSGGKVISFNEPVINIKTDSGNKLDIWQLSSGEKHAIKIFLSCIEAGVSSLIIDEPELSMHIDWQNCLLNHIHTINPECQIICATHSPEIMANINDNEIFKI
jgi:predicted ATPase